MGVEGCLACDLADGRLPLPGGVVHATDHWLIEHCVGPLPVGTLIVKPRRHVVHVWDLDEDEAAELGPLLQTAGTVVAEIAAPDQVYVCLWSHAGATPGHIHFVVQPVSREAMDRHRAYGPSLQVAMFAAGETPDPAAVEAFCDRARRRFSELLRAPATA
jgi:diadenosine tetraphosphate (Ap4A) HIT family hydrolase